MLQIDQFKVNIAADNLSLKEQIAKKLKIKATDIIKLSILKKSIDARKKPEIYYVFSLAIELSISEKTVLNKNKNFKNLHIYKSKEYIFPKALNRPLKRPIIIGAGPAGLFCAYILAKSGYNPIIFERGKMVEERTNDIINFWKTGILDTESNVQFGEGGAGTFSDGKLNTLVNDKLGRNHFVLETFVKFGAPEKILYEAKPHIGTDILKKVITNMRQEIISLGATFYFSTCVTDFIIENNYLIGVKTETNTYFSNHIILAIGHSSRDTFYKLNQLKVQMEAKDFAIGFRIEHPQNMISEAMYGNNFQRLEPAAYKLATNLANDRGIYSFCMCPGGYVVNASSEQNRLVVNGMSYSKRDSKNANSAIVATVDGREFDKKNPLAAIEYQRQIEENAFKLANGAIPQQLLGDFINNIPSKSYGSFSTEAKGPTAFSNLRNIFSNDINLSIIEGINYFGTKIKGFNNYDSILSGIESRTSSPVRIPRDKDFQANIKGLYPCGEGAGYAGGITSAAMDGIKIAEAIIFSTEKRMV